MIKIYSTAKRNLSEICKIHFKELEPILLDRLNAHPLRSRQEDFIRTHLEEIISAPPEELSTIYKRYKAFCIARGKGALKDIKQGLSKIFNYTHFSSKNNLGYNGYSLTRNLDFNTCPYCNRSFIYTIEGTKSKIIRPDIDHFYAKSEFPLLALSFYNLIPSCLVCNRSLKGKKKVQSCMNPYEDGFSNALTFNYFIKDVESGKGFNSRYSVFFTDNPILLNKVNRCKKNVELFKLKEIYELSHGNEISEIIKKHEISSGRYLQMLNKMFPKLGTIEELYNIAFANYFLEEDFDKRPLSKLTKDIFDQLKFFVIDSE
ncbi:MAG: hypothetical protein JWN83_1267 [Chitinophagaceae bacterium]|nr:hypothetical protein [Chitinophagaceae bacterium]